MGGGLNVTAYTFLKVTEIWNISILIAKAPLSSKELSNYALFTVPWGWRLWASPRITPYFCFGFICKAHYHNFHTCKLLAKSHNPSSSLRYIRPHVDVENLNKTFLAAIEPLTTRLGISSVTAELSAAPLNTSSKSCFERSSAGHEVADPIPAADGKVCTRVIVPTLRSIQPVNE